MSHCLSLAMKMHFFPEEDALHKLYYFMEFLIELLEQFPLHINLKDNKFNKKYLKAIQNHII